MNKYSTTRRFQKLCVAMISLATFLASLCRAEKKEITIWLMAVEQAGPNDVANGTHIKHEIADFNKKLEGHPVTVINTQPPLDAQLVVTNQQFAVVNWAWVSSQVKTLEALERFAKQNAVHVNVRFITWDEAFEELRDYRAFGSKGPPPDVAQIGTTWAGYFGSKDLLVSKPGGGGNWRPVRGQPAAALPYINDVRLLYYWKRRPTQSPSSEEFKLDASSWESILSALRQHGESNDSLAFASGLTLNLLHDYASLVWAGQGSPLATGWRDHADLQSSKALSVPLLLSQQAHFNDPNSGPRQIVSFPDASHEEVTKLFVNDGYRATLEPADFISRWYIDFSEKSKALRQGGLPNGDRSFWDYAGVAVPPGVFKGGSELVVMPGTHYTKEAFDLAEFLATDPEYTETLARFGHLPSLRPGFGLDILVGELSTSNRSAGVGMFSHAAQEAIISGHSYPDLDSFPTDLESRAVLESFQTIWRRMADGNVEGVRSAAAQTEFLINSRIDWVVRLRNYLKPLVPLLLLSVACLALIQVRALRKDNERRLAGLLYLANLHTILPSYGTRLRNLAAMARKGIISKEEFVERVEGYSTHLAGPFYTSTCTVSTELSSEMERHSGSMNALDLVNSAWQGASVQFKAAWMADAPLVRFEVKHDGNWAVSPLPHLSIVVLQEWFYNTLRELSAEDNNELNDPSVTVHVGGKGIVVDTPLSLDEQHIRTLHSKRTKSEKRMNLLMAGLGLRLIRNLLWLGYRRRPQVLFSDDARGTRVHFKFPMKSQ